MEIITFEVAEANLMVERKRGIDMEDCEGHEQNSGEIFDVDRTFRSHLTTPGHCEGIFGAAVSKECDHREATAKKSALRQLRDSIATTTIKRYEDHKQNCGESFDGSKRFQNEVTASYHCEANFCSKEVDETKSEVNLPGSEHGGSNIIVTLPTTTITVPEASNPTISISETTTEPLLSKFINFFSFPPRLPVPSSSIPTLTMPTPSIPTLTVPTPFDPIISIPILSTSIRTVPNQSTSSPSPSVPILSPSVPLTLSIIDSFRRTSSLETGASNTGVALGGKDCKFPERNLLGFVDTSADAASEPVPVFMNTHEPFCLVTIGNQGGGKSHTTAVAMEGCITPCSEIVAVQTPMSILVLHYDTNPTTTCEATALRHVCPKMLERVGLSNLPAGVSKNDMIILVSPNNFRKRKALYGEEYVVLPLLFQWKSLTADQIKGIMGLGQDDNQLYVNIMLLLLQKYQREEALPSFEEFITTLKSLCKVSGQGGPLDQRISLLEAFVAESKIGQTMKGGDILSQCVAGRCVVCDLTDPLLSRCGVNGVFQVLVEQYRSLPDLKTCGRLLVVDEAHRYMDGVSTDGLSAAIVDCVRMMRHYGMRVIVSTQSPLALAPEILGLVTVAVLHKFHTKDWFSHLERNLPLEKEAWQEILKLTTGHALVFASKQNFSDHASPFGHNVFKLEVRPRITEDKGRSVVNGRDSDSY